MYKAKDKYDYYQYLKRIFENSGIDVFQYSEINYGLQFKIVVEERSFLIRVYESRKNGIKYDLSQIKDEKLLGYIGALIETEGTGKKPEGIGNTGEADTFEASLIGTDESGKGDYFGPLVIAGVHADAENKKRLKEIGAADSKTLTDSRISKLAEEIMDICKYSIVTIENRKYNELYREIKNLNRLLAWGHARVIEDLLSVVDCGNVLADQFGSPELIKNALMSKGRTVNLEQRHRAEENVVVAAASILARHEYVRAMNKLSEEYGTDFPKGCSGMVTEAAREFVKAHGKEKLEEVAKLHFVVTEKL